MRGGNRHNAAWTKGENDWIRNHWPAAFPEDAMAALPGRTYSSIKHQASRLGIKKDPATVAAINSRTNKGRARTAVHRAKISEALRGHVQSEETKRKRSETQKRIARYGPNNPNWKGDDITEDQSRWRARQIVPPGPCARCGAPGTDVHHKDGNPFNNDASNLERLCAKHHRREHARMDREEPRHARTG